MNSQLFNRLRVLRKRLADEKNVPPYVIFSDASLKEMATYFPQNKTDFSHIKGVGSQKLETYADIFIKEITEFCKESGIATRTKHLSSRPTNMSSRETNMSSRPQRRDLLNRPTGVLNRQKTAANLFKQGLSIQQIANQFNMAPSTIGGYLEKAYIAGEPIDIDSLVPREKQKAIKIAFQTFGTEKLSPVKNHLGDNYTYEELRLTRAKIIRSRT